MSLNYTISDYINSLDSVDEYQQSDCNWGKKKCKPKCFKICECDDEYEEKCDDICCGPQRHVHEFLGSTRLANYAGGIHNHRFAGVTSQAIPYRDSHVHKISINTDYFSDHFHGICVVTGPAIDVGGGKHVHLVQGFTTVSECHKHSFIFTTLIEDPLQ